VQGKILFPSVQESASSFLLVPLRRRSEKVGKAKKGHGMSFREEFLGMASNMHQLIIRHQGELEKGAFRRG